MQYLIDGAGRRVARRVLDDQDTEIEFRGWVYRDGLRPVAEVDALGNLVARYVYSDAGAAAGWNAPDYIQLFDEGGDPSGTYYLVKDQVGSVELVTDVTTGQIVQRMEHDEFGRVLLDTNPGFQPFGFAGGIYDADTSLVRFGARDYDPALGRWTTRDPILFGGKQTNLYFYAGGNPIGAGDPTGLTFLLYDIASGTLTVDPEVAGRSTYTIAATSGLGQYTNDPNATFRSNLGPIPGGQYEIESAALTRAGSAYAFGRFLAGYGDWGSFRVPLTPDAGTNTGGRSGFFLHGGAFAGSKGCIDAGGGFSGNAMTNRLIADIIGDPDGLVGMVVY